MLASSKEKKKRLDDDSPPLFPSMKDTFSDDTLRYNLNEQSQITTTSHRPDQRRNLRLSGSSRTYKRTLQRDRPTCHIAVELPPNGNFSSTSPGHLRVHSHMPFWRTTTNNYDASRTGGGGTTTIYSRWTVATPMNPWDGIVADDEGGEEDEEADVENDSRNERSHNDDDKARKAQRTMIVQDLELPIPHTEADEMMKQHSKTSGSLAFVASHARGGYCATATISGNVPETSSAAFMSKTATNNHTPPFLYSHLSPSLSGHFQLSYRTATQAYYSLGCSCFSLWNVRGGVPDAGAAVPLWSVSGTRQITLSSPWNVSFQPRLVFNNNIRSPVQFDVAVLPRHVSTQASTTSATNWSLRLGSGFRSMLPNLLQAAYRGHSVLLTWAGAFRYDNRNLGSIGGVLRWGLSISRGCNSRWQWLWTVSTLRTEHDDGLTLHIPLWVASPTEWWSLVVGSLVLAILPPLLAQWRTRRKRTSRTTSTHHLAARERAQTQQRLMQRQANRHMSWEKDHQGLVIEKALYYGEGAVALDVTIALQFWVHQSTLELYGRRHQLLGFCNLNSDSAAALQITYLYAGQRYVVEIADAETVVRLPDAARAQRCE